MENYVVYANGPKSDLETDIVIIRDRKNNKFILKQGVNKITWPVNDSMELIEDLTMFLQMNGLEV